MAKMTTESAPPAYGEEHGHVLEAGEPQLATHFGSLTLVGEKQQTPASDTCLAHLRLLHAFEKLKSRIGLQDGLWDIWDVRAASAGSQLDVLVKLREKRWAIYVARAVDRYDAWWKSFVHTMLLEKDMVQAEGSDKQRYEGFTEAEPFVWNADMLPPLDVLMVWHAHMLNPRFYLEDCLRYNYGSMWASGMPWHLINDAIDENFAYQTRDECKDAWSIRTEMRWDNLEDHMAKSLPCPACSTALNIPWTTCGLPRDYTGDRKPGLAGQGYGDGELSHNCKNCNFIVTHDSLRLKKFHDHATRLITKDVAMPGTILDIETGLPRQINLKKTDRLFPSKLIRRGLLVEVAQNLKPGATANASMSLVKDLIEKTTGSGVSRKQLQNVKEQRGLKGIKDVTLDLSLTEMQQTRRMMARYWQNSTFAALDLVGAVLRQGVFSEKMCKVDWLHSPSARATMDRLLKKYSRFVDIIGAYPKEAAVPTLDVDLAWHTHQLAPKSYFDFTIQKTGTFIDHNDKVDEDRLSTAFEWTCKVYMEKYGEPYSECTCWYCETVRVANTSGMSKMFRMSKEEKTLEEWHSSGAAAKVPQPSAHISSHPSVHVIETTARKATSRKYRFAHQAKIQESHAKALKKSSSSTQPRMGPRGKDTVNCWGKNIPVDSPAKSHLKASITAVMYATDPSTVHAGPGAVGSCAVGTCGGRAGCGSETMGMCGAGCTGTGKGVGAGCAGGAG